MAKQIKNKLSIYLIKEKYSSPEDIFRDHEKLETENISNIGNLYYTSSRISAPSWIDKFFADSFENSTDDLKSKIFNSSAKAVLLTSVDNRLFALSFGYGWTLLNTGVWEERFGLKISLNLVDPENLRSIEKTNMSIKPKFSIEQINRNGKFEDFGIDTEQDLIRSVTGRSRDEGFDGTVSGKEALNISARANISNIKEILKYYYTKYKSDDYKEYFEWVDDIFEVKDVRELNSELVDRIKNNNFDDKTFMAVPEIIPWEDVDDFKFKKHSFDDDDIDLPKYLSFLTNEEKKNLSIDTLKKHRIDCISASLGQARESWRVYNCLSSEISYEDQIYILSNGRWYQVENSFAEAVSTSFNSLVENEIGTNFPKYNENEKEPAYNKRAAESIIDACNMDGKMIYHGGPKQKNEFCDLFTKDKKIIHVKRYGASSVLSHLFAQGLVSAQLFLSDQVFREELNKKLPDSHKIEDTSKIPKSSDYKIVYAIISKSDGDLDIPFFSKVNIRRISKILRTFGYTVSLLKIPTAALPSPPH